MFDFSNLDVNHEIFSNKNKKPIGKFKNETPKNIWMDEFITLRSNMNVFRCGDGSKNKLKGICKSQSDNFRFEEYEKCLDGEKFHSEFYKFILKSIDHDMYLQEIQKSTLSVFDDKGNYLDNNINLPSN